MSRKRRICVYCGKCGKMTKDHIPPKNLFEKPRPNTLITVPCCPKCHKGTTKDDEYFRLNIILRDDTPNFPGAKGVYGTTFSGLSRKESTGLRQDLFNRINTIGRIIPSGIYAGSATVYDVDLLRLNKVATRIVKGLYYHEQKKVLSAKYTAKALSLSGLNNLDTKTHYQLRSQIDELIATKGKSFDKNNIFVYWNKYYKEDDCISAWLLLFFGQTAFFGTTIPVCNK